MLEQLGDEDDSRPPPDRTLAGYDEHLEWLVSIHDGIRALHATLIAANSKNGRGPEVKPSPRPRTAIDRARSRRNRAQAEAVRNLFAPRPAEGDA